MREAGGHGAQEASDDNGGLERAEHVWISFREENGEHVVWFVSDVRSIHSFTPDRCRCDGNRSDSARWARRSCGTPWIDMMAKITFSRSWIEGRAPVRFSCRESE